MSRNRQSNYLSKLQNLFGIIVFDCLFFLNDFFIVYVRKQPVSVQLK